MSLVGFEQLVSAPVHPHVLIIVKTHENRVEHILAILQMTWQRKTIFKTLKNWFLGILYRYIIIRIDTYVLKLLQTDFVHFVSIHISLVSIQICLSEAERHLCIESCLHVSIHTCISQKISWYMMYRIMLVWFDTYQSRFQETDVCIDTHTCLYRYIGQNFQFERWSKGLYRYKPSFVSIHVC